MAFNGQIAFITGGGSGIGRVAARQLAAAGKTVAIADVNTDGLKETADGHQDIHAYPLDVTDAAAVEAVIDGVETDLGPIDRVYNGAAIMPAGLLQEQDLDTIHRVMNINYNGLVNVSRFTLARMLERGRGDLINFASMAGWAPAQWMGAYNASKFAVVAYTEVLYHENRDKGVRFACVCPPPVATPLLQHDPDGPWAKLIDTAAPLTPEAVLDAIEPTLEKDRLWVFPGLGTALGWRVRRWFPGLLWRYQHRVEGF